MGLSIFFNLNLCFLTNSKLITSPVALLSNSASTVIPSYVSILSNPTFTVTSLDNFSSSTFLTLTSFLSLFCFFPTSFFSFFSSISSESHAPIFISLASILNLLLESSQETLDSLLFLNCLIVQNFPLFPTSVSIPVFCHLQF